MSANSGETVDQVHDEPQTPSKEIENHGLFVAVEEGNLEAVQEALKSGAEINAKRELYGETALHTAVSHGHEPIIKFLLANEADFNARDDEDWTLLMSACYGHEQLQSLPVIKFLLEQSEMLAKNTEDHPQDTILTSPNKNESAAREITPKTASYINLCNKYGMTALTVACCWSTAEIVHFLLENQADVNVQDEEGHTPLTVATRYGNAKMVEDILSFKPDIHKVRTNGWSAMHHAMRIENDDIRERIVGLLLENRLSASLKDNEGTTPLHLASEGGYLTIIKKLLEQHGVDVNAQNDAKITPLHLASQNGHPGVVEHFLSRKDIEVNVQSSEGVTPLLLAVARNHPEIVQKLIGHGGIDANTSPPGGITPLHVACEQGHLEIVKGLLDWTGIKPNARDFVERTPLILAVERNLLDVVRLLLGETGIDFGAADSWKNTPLHQASAIGSLDIVQMLVNKTKEQVNARNEEGHTALHLACQNGHIDIAKQLFSVGAKSMVGRDSTCSAWYFIVKRLISFWEMSGPETRLDPHADSDLDRKPSMPKPEDIEFFLARADDEEKESAMFWANTNDKRTFLAGVMGIKLSKLIDYELFRLAKSSEYSDQREIVKLLEDEDTDFDPRPITALQWAAFHGRHDVVWWLLKNSKVEPFLFYGSEQDREEAKAIAKSRRDQLTQQKEDPDAKMGYKEGIVEEARETNRGFKLTVDMLTDPPVVENADFNSYVDYDPSQTQILGAHWAIIVDFYQRDGRVELLRRSESVFNVIYAEASPNDGDKGPEGIMNKARTDLKKISNEAAKEKKYERKDLLMRWIHLPANVMKWMEDLAKRISIDKKKSSEEWLSLNDLLQRSWHELPTDTAPGRFMKPVCLKEPAQKPLRKNAKEELHTVEGPPNVDKTRRTSATAETKEPQSPQSAEPQDKAKDNRAEGNVTQSSDSSEPIFGGRDVQETGKYERVALYMPYITFGLCHRNSLSTGSSGAGESSETDSPSLSKELNALKRYEDLMESCEWQTIHGSRSLDQFFYNSLPETDMNDRDQNQVFTRSFFRTPNGDGVPKDQQTWPYLAVGQFWLWVIDEGTIITSSTHRRDSFPDPVGERLFDRMRQANIKKKGQSLPSSVEDMTRFMVTFCVDFLHSLKWEDFSALRQPVTDHSFKDTVSSMSVQLLYEERINLAATKEKQLFSDFKNKMKDTNGSFQKKRAHKELKKRYISRLTKSETQGRGDVSEVSQRFEDRNWASISGAADLLDEVKDILDELTILKTLVARQLDVWQDLVGKDSGSNDARGPAYTLRGVQEMIDMADRVQKSVNDILGLEQNGINIDQAQESARQGTILMAFTIVTVVFTPLSFLTSLFALNVTSFQHNSSGEIEYEPGWIFPILFCGSTAIIGLLMIYAFRDRYRGMQMDGEKLRQSIVKKWEMMQKEQTQRTGSSEGSGLGHSQKPQDSPV